MKNLARRLLLIGLALLPVVAFCEASKRVHSLNQVPGQFKSKEGLAKFREQMSGVPMPDGFGTNLPPGIAPESVVQLVAPGKDAALATLVGVKAWPHRPNTYVAIVCLAGNAAARDEAVRDNGGKPLCRAAFSQDACADGPKDVYLALLEIRDGAALPTRVASYGKSLDVTTDWSHTNLEAPQCAGDTGIHPDTYARFDFAPFRLSPTETAFGIRVSWSEGYAGGGGEFQALGLYALDGERIINVLSEPVYYSKMLAGDWHKDGTRDHTLEEGENIVTVLPHSTQGYYDLQLKSRDTRWKQVFAWDHAAKRYQPVNPGSASK